MKRNDRPSFVNDRGKAGSDPELLAVEALSFLAADADRLGDFLATTGLTREGLRAAADEPGFLEGVLGYIGADEATLVAFASDRGLRPEEVGQVIARARRDPAPST